MKGSPSHQWSPSHYISTSCQRLPITLKSSHLIRVTLLHKWPPYICETPPTIISEYLHDISVPPSDFPKSQRAGGGADMEEVNFVVWMLGVTLRANCLGSVSFVAIVWAGQLAPNTITGNDTALEHHQLLWCWQPACLHHGNPWCLIRANCFLCYSNLEKPKRLLVWETLPFAIGFQLHDITGPLPSFLSSAKSRSWILLHSPEDQWLARWCTSRWGVIDFLSAQEGG